jgi:molybdopterin-binding protein
MSRRIDRALSLREGFEGQFFAVREAHAIHCGGAASPRPLNVVPQEILMKLSARNQLKGKIVAVTKGQTTAHVRIDIGGGVIVTASITNEAVDDLGLRVGDDALAVIKASDVMVGK